MHTNDRLTQQRIRRFLAERLRPAVIAQRHRLDISAWDAPGEPVPPAEALRQTYRRVQPGHAWGPAWGTTWFHATGSVPQDSAWQRAWGQGAVEIVCDLGFNAAAPGFQAEGLAFTADGEIIEAVHPRSQSITARSLDPAAIDVYVEAAGNPDVAGTTFHMPTPYGVPEARDLGPLYTLAGIDLVIRDVTVAELVADAEALWGLVQSLPPASPRRAKVLIALDSLVDAVDPDDVAGTAAAGREVLAGVLAQKASASAHVAYAVGHAHIDSAWLWPTRETVRKVARTFSGVLARMDEDPGFIFAASSAQQYAWMRDRYPNLFARIRERVAQGRFVPVGSMWVEADTNMPGGEAFARQLVAGKRFFLEELGVETRDVWLPDSFGYSGALPQLARAAGAPWFLSQKLSWNEDDRMPHHTFTWEGIDGSRVLAHFPPVDTYNSDLSAAELLHAQESFAEKGVASGSIVPFGYGDGGGGPTREMLASAQRYADLEGVPRVRLASPNDFFADAEAELPSPEVWSGEMYLEFHRGTYSSQARTKRGNRRSEHLLREAELWAATAAVRLGANYPYDALERAWHTVLLNQFHDILPGSSIGWVYRQAEREHAEVAAALEPIITSSLGALAGSGQVPLTANPAPHARDGVAPLGVGEPGRAPSRVRLEAAPDGGAALVSDVLRVHVDAAGLIDSILDASGREAVAAGEVANLLQISRDTPKAWDAWDLDREHRRHTADIRDLVSLELVEDAGEGAQVRPARRVGASAIRQVITVRDGDPTVRIETEVDWHERQKVLKQVFGLDVHADRSAAETQFGHVFRPTHSNTSWDAAKFEVCAHRWVHVGEAGYGVAVANDATYGHDIGRYRTAAGFSATRVALTLLRAPLFPDPEADQGQHAFTTVIHPGAGIAEAVVDGYRTNLPSRALTGAGPVDPLVQVSGAVVESVKLAEDRGGDVIVRLYEPLGGRCAVTVRAGFDARTVVATDLLERELAEQDLTVDGGVVTFTLRAFEVRTLRLRR